MVDRLVWNWRLLCALAAASVMCGCSGTGSTSPSTAPGALCAPISPTLRATTLTFDDVVFTPNAVNNPSLNNVPDGYGGFTWTGFQVSQPVSCAQSPAQSGCPANNGLVNSVVSPPKAVFTPCNNGCVAGSVSSSTPFDVVSGYFTGLFRDGLQVTVTGANAATNKTCTVTFSVNTTGPTFEVLNMGNVTTVTFLGSGGTHNSNIPAAVDGSNFGLDNLAVNR